MKVQCFFLSKLGDFQVPVCQFSGVYPFPQSSKYLTTEGLWGRVLRSKYRSSRLVFGSLGFFERQRSCGFLLVIFAWLVFHVVSFPQRKVYFPYAHCSLLQVVLGASTASHRLFGALGIYKYPKNPWYVMGCQQSDVFRPFSGCHQEGLLFLQEGSGFFWVGKITNLWLTSDILVVLASKH